MRTLTPSEKRTIRLGAAGVAIYLLCFGGFRMASAVRKRNQDYRQLRAAAENLKSEVRKYRDRAEIVQAMMDRGRMDPAKLDRATVVAQASAAIQNAALSGGIQVGPVRESPGQASNKEAASLQLEGTGPIPAVLSLLQRINTLGYPLIIDNVQLNQEKARPGTLKVNLTIIISDFDQWKGVEAPHA